ncbi:MAG: prepilin peptidase [Terriglobia bacterium]
MILPELFIILLGLVVGSFLNVCIFRIPEGESVVFPNSHCPRCGAAIKPFDNIPVFSFLFLRGRCRACRGVISWQYPLVEGLTALVYWATIHWSGLQGRSFILLLFFSALIVLVFIDLNHRILPDVITLPGTVAGLAFSLVSPVNDGSAKFLLRLAGYRDAPPILLSFLDSLLGAVVCGGFLWLVAELYFRLRKMEGLGFGDIKLMGFVGAFLGLRLALMTIMLGSLVGALVGFLYIKLAGKEATYELPFGSFLGLSAILAALVGGEMMHAYTALFPIF